MIHGVDAALGLAAAVIAALYAISFARLLPADRPSTLSALFGSTLSFLSKPADFLRRRVAAFGPVVAFSVLRRRVVHLNLQDRALRSFYLKANDQTLNFTLGYRALFGNVLGAEFFRDRTDIFLKVVTTDRLRAVAPRIAADTSRALAQWPDAATLDVFEKVYDVVFLMSTRVVTCDELADAHFGAVLELFKIFEKGYGGLGLLLPWLPTPAARRRAAAKKRLTALFKDLVERRVNNPDEEVRAAGGGGAEVASALFLI